MFDSHCHLDFPELDAERVGQLAEARHAGVRHWFVPGCYPDQWSRVQALVGEPGVVVGFGIHPWWAGAPGDLDEVMACLRKALREFNACALGECGLDQLRLTQSPWQDQLQIFEAQLVVARELCLPLVLHQVRARGPFLSCLDRVGLSPAGGVVHGFSGDRAWADTLVRRGLLLGIGPALLRSGRERLREVAATLPLSCLVVETDAPDQGSSGNRGRLADLVRVVEGLAVLRGIGAGEIAQATTLSARRLYASGGDSAP